MFEMFCHFFQNFMKMFKGSKDTDKDSLIKNDIKSNILIMAKFHRV